MPALAVPALLLPALFVAASATFLFGKRKPEPVEPLPPDLPAPPPPRTLNPLTTFALTGDGYSDREACARVWDALELPVRDSDETITTRYFAVTAFDPAPEGRAGAALASTELARDGAERGYTVLLVDADVTNPLLHTLPLFAPRDGTAPTASQGLAEVLIGEVTRLDPLLKLAWRTEGLLLLPAGNAPTGELKTGELTRFLRSAASLAEIVLLVAPPLFAEHDAANAELLPRMNGVLVAYPSGFSAQSDTEALEKLEAMNVAQVGAIVAPPTGFANTGAETGADEIADVDLPPTVAAVYPDPTPDAEAAEPTPDAPRTTGTDSTSTPRPSFLTAPPVEVRTRRGDARRGVPVESVPVYTTAPTVPVPAIAPVPVPEESKMSLLTTYRPDVSLELIPATDDVPVLVLRAEVGGAGSGAKLLLEVRTVASEAKRLRADNPASGDALLLIESLTATTAPEDATTLRLVVREGGDSGAATLLEATLETPDALRIKSGKATASGVPPVRFEVTTEPDDTARFRATVPPLGDAPALFVDLERSTTDEGRLSRIVLRLA